MSEAGYSIKDWLAILAIVTAVGGLFFSGWMALIQGKIRSITTLWTKLDALRNEYSVNRLADAKEYATKSEVATAVRGLETKIDASEEKLEMRLRDLDQKLDRLISMGRRDG